MMEATGDCPYFACLGGAADGGPGHPFCRHAYSVVPEALVLAEPEAAQFLRCGGHAERCQIPMPYRRWPSAR